METKRCKSCSEDKPLSQYHSNRCVCKECANAIKREHYNNNKSAALANKKEYYQKNKESIKAKVKEYRNRPTGKECRKEYNQKYYAANREKLIQDSIEYERERKKIDPLYRAVRNVRDRARKAFKDGAFSKTTESLLQCSLADLKIHIESKFQDGMSWDNYGYTGWHVDHIIPLSSANSLEELEKLCHYTNLQPLWAIDNFKKGDSVITH
jgi:hypothetical protein